MALGGGVGEAAVQDVWVGGAGRREEWRLVGWLVVSEQVGANHQSPVQSGSAASLRRSPPLAQLGVVLLARSVDVVEERHGEGHAQELRRKRRGSSE